MIKLFLLDSVSSFGEDLIVAFLGSVLGLGSAYLIYWLSIQQGRNDRLKYFVALIEQIMPSIKRQATFCSKHSELILKEPFSNEMLKLEANRDTKRLADKIDQEGVYHAFLWKYGRSGQTYKTFQELYGYIDYVDYLVDDLIKTNERILTFTWERKKQYQLTFNSLTKAMRSLALFPEIIEHQPQLIEYTNSLLDEFSKDAPEGENIVPSYEVIVTPLHEYIVTKAKRHEKVTELLFLIKDLIEEYNGIELSAKHNAIDFNDYSVSFSKVANKLFDKSSTIRSDFGQKSNAMVRRSKIYYVPGMISLIFLPIFYIYFASIELKSRTITSIPLVLADTLYVKQHPKVFEKFRGHYPPKRTYTLIELTGNHEIDLAKLKYAQIRIKEILISNDTINGLHFKFNSKSEYGMFVKIIDLLRLEGAKSYMLLDYSLWFYQHP